MSDALARPTFQPFDLDAEYVWLECELPKYEGFKVEVRMNLRNKDRKRLNTTIDEINAERERIGENTKRIAIDIEERKKAAADDPPAMALLIEEQAQLIEQANVSYDANVNRLHTAIAPYVRAWNVMDRDDAGNLVDAPPPMTAGVEAFDAIDQKMSGWLTGALLSAYRGGKGLADSLLTPSESGEQSSASNETTPNAKPTINRSGNGQKSSKNSRSRSASTSATSGPGSTGTPMPLSST